MIFYLSLVRGTGIRVRIRVRTVLVREYYSSTMVPGIHVRDVHVYRYTFTSTCTRVHVRVLVLATIGTRVLQYLYSTMVHGVLEYRSSVS